MINNNINININNIISEFANYKNKLIEITGMPDSGKSNVVLKIIKKAQELYNDNYITCYIDLDNKINKKWFIINNINLNKTYFAFDINNLTILERLVKSSDLVILDSLSMNNNFTIKLLLSKLKQYSELYDTNIIIVNQLRYSLENKQYISYYDNIVKQYCDIRFNLYNNSIYRNILESKINKLNKFKNDPDSVNLFNNMSISNMLLKN